MPERVTIEAAIAQIKSCQPSLIAIDGLPCSGKTTLAELLQRRLEVDYVGLDEFILPEQDWVSRNKPTFPFEFIRYEEFVSAIRSLATIGECSFYPFDFDTLIISQQSRTVTVAKPVVIEGVSSLNPTLCPLYDIRIFVDSDRTTTLQAAIQRGVGHWETEWRELFLPSVDLYMLTEPQNRADLIVAGRGA